MFFCTYKICFGLFNEKSIFSSYKSIENSQDIKQSFVTKTSSKKCFQITLSSLFLVSSLGCAAPMKFRF